MSKSLNSKIIFNGLKLTRLIFLGIDLNDFLDSKNFNFWAQLI